MISSVIAQAAPETLKTWLEVFFWLAGSIGTCLGIAVACQSLFGKKEKTEIEQPLVVKKHGGVVTDDDLLQVHGRIKRERAEIDMAIAELRAEDRRLREKLDNEIKELNDHMDAIPGRVIDLLRQTKGLL